MERRGDGSIKVSMETFTKKLLEKFWQGKINPSHSPLGMDKLSDDDPPDPDNYPVRPAIGNFIWLVVNLRFDIAPAVNVIARKQTKPTAKLVRLSGVFFVICQLLPTLLLFTRRFLQAVLSSNALQTARLMLTRWEAMLGFWENRLSLGKSSQQRVQSLLLVKLNCFSCAPQQRLVCGLLTF